MLLNPLQQMRLARLLRQKAQHASLSDRRRLLNHAAVFEVLARAQVDDPRWRLQNLGVL
jgi:hypothetical protein